jgi:PcRGLX-like N-terminal RIFT barrel domain
MEPIKIKIDEQNGIYRCGEPVSCGIPLIKGDVYRADELQLVDGAGQNLPACFTPLAHWNDKSIKWVLADFQVDIAGNEKKVLRLAQIKSIDALSQPNLTVKVEEKDDCYYVDTGACRFTITKTGLLRLDSAVLTEPNVLPKPITTKLTDKEGNKWQPYIELYDLERSNNLLLVLSLSGCFGNGQTSHELRFKCRYHFFAGKGTVRIDFTIWNPQAAIHKRGVWDLGDEHSIFFKDLTIEIPVVGESRCQYALTPGSAMQTGEEGLLIYQDSSGGENWQSTVHINQNDEIPVSFKGYRVYGNDKLLAEGDRATPFMSLIKDQVSCTCTLPHFWQNFPKALSFGDHSIAVKLFPDGFNDLFELQGGEQKTHKVFIHFGNDDQDEIQRLVASMHEPLYPHVESRQYSLAGIAPRPVPLDDMSNDPDCVKYQEYISTAIKGNRSFFKRREIIDEYGWRNFGEMYADHEAVSHTGNTPFISHYNNQYDGIKGGLIQFMRTGDREWYRLAEELACHVADIDIYRTDRDRYEYNNGLFWHTDHHVDACTATHRTTSEKHFALKDPRFIGGGPSYEHNYSSGFCYLYWMTGEEPFKECVLRFADYISRGLDGPDTLLEYTRNVIKKLKVNLKLSAGATPFGSAYGLTSGPGRGSGNALNTLIDSYLITSDTRYLQKAGWLIRQCVAPDDDIDSRDLLNAELRWMYLIFLQALGRYLEVCVDRQQWDDDFHYARATFVNYAEWMRKNEYPYLEKPEILEFPNETWAAQDIRKADILALAVRYCEKGKRDAFLQKSRYFFEKTLEHVLDFGENSFLTRPIVVLMTNGLTYMEIVKDTATDRIPSFDSCTSAAKKKKHQKFAGRGLGEFWKILKNTSLKKEISWLQCRLKSK